MCNKPTKLIVTWTILMLSKRYESTEVDRRNCPRGLLGLPAVKLNKSLKYEKRLLIRFIHHFKSDLIHNMDHMRTSGTETLISDPEPNKSSSKM